MKTLRTLLVIAIAVFGFTANSFGQSTATASTTATLIVPISIAKITDMNFGTVAASATSGTVALDYADGVTPSGGATVVSSTRHTAKFTVTGDGSSTFSIAVPATPITLTGSVSGTMTVGSFTADLGSSGTLSSGTKDIMVKATLNVPANAVAGSYTNASGLFVTVNYN